MSSLQIVCRDFPLTPAIRTSIGRHAARLEKLYRRVQRCEVTIASPHRNKHKGRIFHVSIRIDVPGHTLSVSREAEEDPTHQTLHFALRDAFLALGRRLEDQVDERRGFVKTLEQRPLGTVLRTFPDRDFGFLADEDGREIYFHRNALKGLRLEALEPGTQVRYEAEDGIEGPQAVFVRAKRRARRGGTAAAA
jgi:cold shock CspA family protein/ribosome-associated translation inhibitor RaiA